MIAVVVETGVVSTVPAGKIKNVSGTFPYKIPHGFMKVLSWISRYNVVPLGQFFKSALGGVDLTHTYRERKEGESAFCSVNTLTLNAHQRHARDVMAEAFRAGTRVALLDGVTGSGKTEVYLEHVQDVWHSGGQVLVCVPEIGLTPAWIDRFEARFGHDCAVWHSRMTSAQRWHVWKRAISGEPLVVVAARSGALIPFANLKLIVMDEEHDGSYKQEDPPVYHCRDVLLARSHYEGAHVILSSATPSLETYYHTQQGKYAHAEMKVRVGTSLLPEVATVDMRHLAKTEGETENWLHGDVLAKIRQTLAEKSQVFLFLNRRGYAPLLMCGSCGYRFGCPQCSTSLVMHTTRNTLQCHHCGFVQPNVSACPTCEGTHLIPCGPGIERLEAYAKKLFPEQVVATVSSDHIATVAGMNELTEKINTNAITLIIGTQMLAKGHHFPNLTCVVVVDGDAGLMSEDWRACEKTYQLIHQVAGRAGRGEKPGCVYIQTFQPDHPIFQALRTHDRESAYQLELTQRKQSGLTPFGRLLAIVVSATSVDEVRTCAQHLRAMAPAHPDVRIYGPAPAPLERVRNHYRWRFLVMAPNDFPLSRYAEMWITEHKFPRSVRVKVDMDPQSFL